MTDKKWKAMNKGDWLRSRAKRSIEWKAGMNGLIDCPSSKGKGEDQSWIKEDVDRWTTYLQNKLRNSLPCSTSKVEMQVDGPWTLKESKKAFELTTCEWPTPLFWTHTKPPVLARRHPHFQLWKMGWAQTRTNVHGHVGESLYVYRAKRG